MPCWEIWEPDAMLFVLQVPMFLGSPLLSFYLTEAFCAYCVMSRVPSCITEHLGAMECSSLLARTGNYLVSGRSKNVLNMVDYRQTIIDIEEFPACVYVFLSLSFIFPLISLFADIPKSFHFIITPLVVIIAER